MIWFSKKEKKQSKTWSDITLGQFTEIESILNGKRPTMEIELKRAVYGEEGGDISFLNEPIKRKSIRPEYTVNGHRYKVQANLGSLTMSQYIDATNAKVNRDLLAVLLIPWGHRYNDGGDGYEINGSPFTMEDVKRDMDSLDMVSVQSIAFFLSRQAAAFALCMADSLEKRAKGTMMKSSMAAAALWRSTAGLILSQAYVSDSITPPRKRWTFWHRR